MTVEKIYFDMDGVLADFDRGVIELLGLPKVDQANRTHTENLRLHAEMGRHPHFYDCLEPMPGAFDLFHDIYNKYGDRCEILSGIPRPDKGVPTAGEDKISWVRRLLSPDVKINVVYRSDKKKYCLGESYILIDDFSANIESWKKAGGTGILHRDVSTTRDELKKLGIL